MKTLITTMSILLSFVFVYSQDNITPFAIDYAFTQNQPAEILSSVDDALILSLNSSAVKTIVQRKSDVMTMNFPIDKSRTVLVNLKKTEVLAPYGKVVAGTVNGDVEINMRDKFVSYIGEVSDIKNSHVSITFFDDFVMGILITPNESYVLGKLDKPGYENYYVLYQTSKMKIKNRFECGTDALGIPESVYELQKSLKPQLDNASPTLLKADVAVESDYETFVRFGSVENATKYLLSLVAVVSAVYMKDVNTQLFVSYIRVWSDINDPYNGSTSSQLLNEFRAYWNANMQSVPRVVAHYISTRAGNLGGIAYLNVLCSPVNGGNGYAFSNISGSFNYLPTYSWDLFVVAHEWGHNFGSYHTHNCFAWQGGPIDTCVTPEGGCYNGPIKPIVGTIMSYCHLTGSVFPIFGPLPSDRIRTQAESAFCIVSNVNYLLALPNGGEIYRGGENRWVIWGTTSTSNVNVEYSINNGSTWSTIQNNVPATNRYVLWNVPYIPTTTQARVRFYEVGNPSNGDMSDSVFQIRPVMNQFELLTPPQLSRFYVAPNDTTTLYFTWRRSGTLPEFRYRWNLFNLEYSRNYNQLSNNSGLDSVLSIKSGKIDSIIASWGVQTNDSLRGRWLVMAYTQLDSLMSATNHFITFIRSIIGVKNISTEIPKEFFISQNYPNPFNPITKVKFGVPKSSLVKLTIYDILGREIALLVNQKLEPGTFEVDWNAADFPSGVYFYRIEAEDFVRTNKMLLIK